MGNQDPGCLGRLVRPACLFQKVVDNNTESDSECVVADHFPEEMKPI
jgi:hypothetical protein